eukprot:4568590-Pyramimonas_sp.AAC.1
MTAASKRTKLPKIATKATMPMKSKMKQSAMQALLAEIALPAKVVVRKTASAVKPKEAYILQNTRVSSF